MPFQESLLEPESGFDESLLEPASPTSEYDYLPPLPKPGTPEFEHRMLASELAGVRGEDKLARFISEDVPLISRLRPPRDESATARQIGIASELGGPVPAPPSALERAAGAALDVPSEVAYELSRPSNLPLIPLAAIPGVREAMALRFGGEALGAGAGEIAGGIETGQPETIGHGAANALLGGAMVRAPIAGVTSAPGRIARAMEQGRFQRARPIQEAPVEGEAPVPLLEDLRQQRTTEAPNAGNIESPATVHGNLRTPAIEIAKEVPVEEGGAGVRPNAPEGVAEAQDVLGTLNQLNERAKALGYSDVRTFNLQNVTRADTLSGESASILKDYSDLVQRVTALDWKSASNLPDELFSRWEKRRVMDEQSISRPEDITDTAALHLALRKRGSPNSAEVLRRLKNSRKKTDWTVEEFKRRTGEDISPQEVSEKNLSAKEFNDLLDTALDVIGKETAEAGEGVLRLTEEGRVPNQAPHRMAPPDELQPLLDAEGVIYLGRMDHPTDPSKSIQMVEIYDPLTDPGDRNGAYINFPVSATPEVIAKKIADARKRFDLQSPREILKANPGTVLPREDFVVTVSAPRGEDPGYVQIVDPKATEESGAITLPKGSPDFSVLPSGRYTFKEAAEKLEEIKLAEAPKQEPVSAEAKISPEAKSSNVFDMDEGDLGDLFNEQFGRQEPSGVPGQYGRPGKYSFPTYDRFKAFMDERYGALDIESMRNAFAEAPVENKIRYIKENKGAEDHKKGWITHLATGAELPKERPPVAQPAPVPPGMGAPPSRPSEPPPPPRASTPYRKFDVMALTQLFRQFEKFPTVNERLTRAYGRFLPAKEAIELKQRLLWDTALAERVLGHEIGHFIDLAVQLTGKGRPFAERIEPFNDLRSKIGSDKELRADAVSLSRQWRGNFAKGDRYRDTANELFADFMSAMFNNPEWVNQNHPRLHDAFNNVLGSKPSFRETYREIESWLAGDTMVAEWMKQQRGSVERTIDDLLKERTKRGASFSDFLKGSFVNIWHRAFEREGRPEKLGSSITDELEYSKSWAATQNALYADTWTKEVQPKLDLVNPDPLEARANLHAYSQAMRTIWERRAGGKFIENNPKEGREVLKRILELDDGLRSKFATQLDRSADAQLYDLAAAVAREIHDRGEPFAQRIAREIDKLDLGVTGDAVLNAFNVRGKLLNPGGLTEANAAKVEEELRKTMTPQQWTALETAANRMRDLTFEAQSKAHDEGLISDKVWKELIEPNQGNYVPYAALDYWEGKVKAGVLPQKGTARDIADVTVSSQLKVAALNAWRQRQRQVQLLRDAYAKGGVEVPVGERLRRASDIDRIRQRNSQDDVSRAVLWVDGQPHLVEFPNDPGKTLEAAMESAAFYEHIHEWLSRASNLTHGMMQLYTTLSVPFLVYRNPVRGARTGALRVGFRSIGKQYLNPADLAHATTLAKNYADAAFGAPMLPEVRSLVENQMLMPPRLASAMVRDADNLRELIENGGILSTQIRQLHGHQWPWWKGGEFGRGTYEVAEKVFNGYEAFEKIQNYLAAKARGASEAQAVAIGRRAGIPKPGVGGHLTLPMEVFFPWTRVHIQGIRSTLDTLRDPQYRKGFAARFMITEGLPRVLKIGIGMGVLSGLVSWLLSPNEDKDDPVMAEVFRRISPYKMALDDIVPLMLYDTRTGKHHYFNEFTKGSSIPRHFEVISFRIPASEEGRLWGTLLYSSLVSIPGIKEKMGRPGEDFLSATTKWAANYLAPGISPAITTTKNLKDMILEGKNPEDPYRGQPSANRQLFDAGGVDRAQAIAGYTLNQLGGPGEIAAVLAMNFGVLDPRAADALKKRLSADKTPLTERIPLARNMFSYDNYADYRTTKLAELEENQLRARARLIMSDSVRGLYDYYWRNSGRKDMTQVERTKFGAASFFVNKIWGDLKNPNSFYAKAAHAIGPDGSKMSKETVRRDLDQAAAAVLARFATP